jgi:hypothetical protein
MVSALHGQVKRGDSSLAVVDGWKLCILAIVRNVFLLGALLLLARLGEACTCDSSAREPFCAVQPIMSKSPTTESAVFVGTVLSSITDETKRTRSVRARFTLNKKSAFRGVESTTRWWCLPAWGMEIAGYLLSLERPTWSSRTEVQTGLGAPAYARALAELNTLSCPPM